MGYFTLVPSVRSTQGPNLASALKVLLVDLHVVGALGLGDGEEFGNVLGASVAESRGPWIVGQVELDLELAPIPAGLRGVVVGVDHEVLTAGFFWDCLSTFRFASCCCLLAFCF